MESRVLSTEEFGEFSEGVVLFAHITTQIEGRENDDLLGRKGGRGFPYVVAMNADGDVTAIAKQRSVEGFRAMIEAGKEYQAKKARDDLSAAEKLDLFRFDLKVGNVGLQEGRKALAGMKDLDEGTRKELESALLAKEVQSHFPKARTPEARQASGKAYAEMWEAGKVPREDNLVKPFFILILDHAEAVEDAGLFEKALGELKDRFGSNPRAKAFFEKQEARLSALLTK